MKMPTYQVSVMSGGTIRISFQEKTTKIMLKPWESLFEALWNYFSRLAGFDQSDPVIVVRTGRATYAWEWNNTATHYCFADGGLSEKDFAAAMLVTNKY